MCSNYEPITDADRLLSFFGAVSEGVDRKPTLTFPTGRAPFIRLVETSSGRRRVAEDGHFGLLPGFAKEVSYGRRTYNARTETVASLPSFRESWKKGWRCIIPAAKFYEPCWETGKAVRWAIQQVGQVPMGIAGIYRKWHHPDGTEAFTFAMLTVNADGHPVMTRFHKPGDEKRMVVILDPTDYDAWLECPVDDASHFFRQWNGPLDAFPAPLAPRSREPEPPPLDLRNPDDPGRF